MRLVIQRVSSATVSIKIPGSRSPATGRAGISRDQIVGQIGPGFLVYVGFGVGDTQATVDHLTHKLLHLRVMADDQDRFNRSVLDTHGDILIVSQFTLYADLKGHRPSFTKALPPIKAQILYDYFINKLKESSLNIQSGTFGAMMEVTSTNSGPVTIIMESLHE